MTPAQLRIIHTAKRQLELDDASYRLILRNVGKVESSKDLTNAGLEDVMALFESRGYCHPHHGENYWTKKSQSRGTVVTARAARFIRELAGQSRYNLEALVMRHSGDRTDIVEELYPREAWLLTEMLKGSTAREQNRSAGVREQQPPLFGGI